MKHQQLERANNEVGQNNTTYFNILIELQKIRHLMSVDEVATLLKNSIFTIYRMARQHQIPSMRIGGQIKFDPSALAMWLTKKDPALAVAARQLLAAA